MQKQLITLKTKQSDVQVNPEHSLLPVIPLGDRAYIKRQERADMIEGAKTPLFAPKGSKDDFTKEDYATGKICALGPGFGSYPIPEYIDGDGNAQKITVGLTVNYWHQQAIDVEIDEEKYQLIRVSDIFAVV